MDMMQGKTYNIWTYVSKCIHRTMFFSSFTINRTAASMRGRDRLYYLSRRWSLTYNLKEKISRIICGDMIKWSQFMAHTVAHHVSSLRRVIVFYLKKEYLAISHIKSTLVRNLGAIENPNGGFILLNRTLRARDLQSGEKTDMVEAWKHCWDPQFNTNLGCFAEWSQGKLCQSLHHMLTV
jgi:hypothetical protein